MFDGSDDAYDGNAPGSRLGSSALAPASGAARVPGELRVLACPAVLCPHAEFAIAAVLEAPVSLAWTAQPAAGAALTPLDNDGGEPHRSVLQATLTYVATSGSAGRLATKMRGMGPVIFEVVEAACPGVDAERYSYHPHLGLHRAALSATGDVMLSESVVATLLGECAGQPSALAHGLERLLGRAWDELLEPLRLAGEGSPVSALRRTG